MRARSLSDREWRLCGDGLRQVCKYIDTFTRKGGGQESWASAGSAVEYCQRVSR